MFFTKAETSDLFYLRKMIRACMLMLFSQAHHARFPVRHLEVLFESKYTRTPLYSPFP